MRQATAAGGRRPAAPPRAPKPSRPSFSRPTEPKNGETPTGTAGNWAAFLPTAAEIRETSLLYRGAHASDVELTQRWAATSRAC